MSEDKINEFLNGRKFTVVTGGLLLLAALAAVPSFNSATVDNGRGLCFALGDLLTGSPLLSCVVNLGCIALIAILLTTLNKTYSFVRAFTMVFVSSFFLFELSTPSTSATLGVGTLMCVLLAAGANILFSSYQDKRAQYNVLLVTTVLAACALFQWAAILLVIAFGLGFGYMRAMNIRSLLALLIGLVTPLWIVLGLGIAEPSQLSLPTLPALKMPDTSGQSVLLIVWTAIVTIMTISLTVVNLFTIFNYRLQFRVYNAFFVLVTTLTVIALCIDFGHVTRYLPLLYMCASIQLAHTFTVSNATRRYILVLGVMVACIVMCAVDMYLTPVAVIAQ